uniref:Uncharacterized protein n=1 Tax=Pyrodinium bahamense TaxID=73915 RepID=A0A7S0FG94_9DINO|mmetsp:Transcript_28311/g.77900  ORF Transcript_28311/g.77900 Transcript_28311/m.77900 type:complete len:180 (+) Transcript_28311:256-795(+)
MAAAGSATSTAWRATRSTAGRAAAWCLCGGSAGRTTRSAAALSCGPPLRNADGLLRDWLRQADVVLSEVTALKRDNLALQISLQFVRQVLNTPPRPPHRRGGAAPGAEPRRHNSSGAALRPGRSELCWLRLRAHRRLGAVLPSRRASGVPCEGAICHQGRLDLCKQSRGLASLTGAIWP